MALLALLDTYNSSLALETGAGRMLRQRLRFHLGNLSALRPAEAIRYVAEKMRIAKDGELLRLIGSGADAGSARASEVERSLQVVNDSAASAYQPQPYPGTITVFKPAVNYDVYPDPKMGWGDLALEGLDIVQLSVNPHAMLLEPYVEELAAQLRARLPDAEPSEKSLRLA